MKLGLLFLTEAAVAGKRKKQAQLDDVETFSIGEKDYTIVHADPMSFWEAKKYCDSIGFGLPVPKNDEENRELSQLEGGNFYLGITQEKGHNTGLIGSEWRNVYSGQRVSYTNWRWGQPNNYNYNEHYAIMLMWGNSSSTGTWNDGSVDGRNNASWQRKQTICWKSKFWNFIFNFSRPFKRL